MSKECNICRFKCAPDARFCTACGYRFREHVEAYDAFISYRREGGSHIAVVIKLMLEAGFNKHVFLDVDELQVGRFDESLLDRIERAPNFILVLNGRCLQRCADKTDWLKREIVHAIETQRNIIPILVDGFAFPDQSDMELLPDAMRVLPNLQAVTYSHVHRDAAVRRVAEYLVPLPPVEDPAVLKVETRLIRATPMSALPVATISANDLATPTGFPKEAGRSFEVVGKNDTTVGVVRTDAPTKNLSVPTTVAPPESVSIQRIGKKTTDSYESTIAHTSTVNVLAVSPNGRLLASGSDDQTVKIWALPEGRLIQERRVLLNRARTLAIGPDSKKLFTENCRTVSDRAAIQVWNLPDGQFNGEQLEGPVEPVMKLIVIGEKDMILAAGEKITFWNLSDGKLIGRIDTVKNVHGIVASQVVDVLVCREYSSRMKLFGLFDRAILKVMPEPADEFVILPDGRHLVSCHRSTISFWDLPSGQLIERISVGSDQLIRALAVTPDGRILAMGSSDGTVKLIDLRDLESIKMLRGHSQTVESLAISPDGSTLFSGSQDKTIRIWDLPGGEYRGCLNG